MSKIFLPDPIYIKQAVDRLINNQLVVVPTETVYGLAANATSDDAVLKIFAQKKRPTANPLIVHVKHLDQANHWGIMTPTAYALAHKFWPGPLTLVLEKRKGLTLSLSDWVTAGLDTVAIRVSNHPIMHTLLSAIDFPLAAPSANPSGRLSPTLASHVANLFQDQQLMILDGGSCNEGLESTIIDCTTQTPTLLRHGSLPAESICSVVPIQQNTNNQDCPKSPGMMFRHYAPKIPIRLNALAPTDLNEGLLAFGPNPINGFRSTLNLSQNGDLQEAARHLFRYLHDLENMNIDGIAVMQIPAFGLGFAINDRLKRAAYATMSPDKTQSQSNF